MNRRVWRWIALGLIGLLLYALLLAWFMPADYVARAVNAFNNDVNMQEPSGTLWQGSATLGPKQTGRAPYGRLAWDVSRWRLLGGALLADLRFHGDDLDASTVIDADRRRYQLQRLRATAPASRLARFYAPAGLAGLSGQLLLVSDHLNIEHNDVRGSAELLWSDAASRLLPVKNAGTYKLLLTGEGKYVTLAISTVQGVLQITGQGEWRLFEDGMLRVKGTVASTSPQPELDAILRSIGPAQPNGARSFDFQTRLTPIRLPR